MTRTIFVSYSSKNRAAIDALANDLRAVDYAVWYDQELTGGNDWWAMILDNLRRCDIFVFGLTMQWLNSHPSKLEYEYAQDLQKPMLPVLLGDVNVKVLPSHVQRLQLIDYQEADKHQLITLWKALSRLPSAPPLPDPLPTPPTAPLSPFATLIDLVGSKIHNRDEQDALIEEFRGLLENPATADEARAWLERYRRRSDLPTS